MQGNQVPGSRRPLGAAVITLIVIDAVLVLVLLVLLVRALPRGPVAAEGSATPTVAAEPVLFASPTGNISCAIAPDAAGCEIAHFMYATPTLEGCTGDVGHEIEVTADGARWVCRDGVPASPGPEIPVLDWGDSITEYGFTCTSTGNGVTCTHEESGRSFHLERREYTLG